MVLLVAFSGQSISATSKAEMQIPLDSVFVLLDENSNILKLSQAGIETAKKNVSVVRSSRLPSVKIGVSARYIGDAKIIDRDFSHSQTADVPDFGNCFSVEAYYSLFDGGLLARQVDMAKLGVESSVVHNRKNILDLKLLVAGYYLDLCRLQNQKSVYLKNIEQTDKLIELIRAKHREGLVLVNDITRMELERENLHIGLVETENNMSICNLNLVTAIGLPKGTVIAADTSVNSRVNHDLMKCQLLDTALMYRPELQTVSVHEEIAGQKLKMAKTRFFPSVSIFAGDNLDGPVLTEIPAINKNINNWYAGIGLDYELSNIFKAKKSVETAKCEKNEAALESTLALEQAAAAIHSADIKFREAEEKVKMYDKSLQLAEENYNVVNNCYLNGMALITDILDASTMKLNAQLQVVNARLNVTYSYFRLLRELGKDL